MRRKCVSSLKGKLWYLCVVGQKSWTSEENVNQPISTYSYNKIHLYGSENKKLKRIFLGKILLLTLQMCQKQNNTNIYILSGIKQHNVIDFLEKCVRKHSRQKD